MSEHELEEEVASSIEGAAESASFEPNEYNSPTRSAIIVDFSYDEDSINEPQLSTSFDLLGPVFGDDSVIIRSEVAGEDDNGEDGGRGPREDDASSLNTTTADLLASESKETTGSRATSVRPQRLYSEASMDGAEENVVQKEDRFVSLTTIRKFLEENEPIKVRTRPAYIIVEDKELDLFGNPVSVKKLVRRVREEIRLLKKPIIVRVKFNKMLNDGDEVVEEEEDVHEEMSIEHITSTVLVKRRNSHGDDVLKQETVVRERIMEPKVPRRIIGIIVASESGDEVEETVELKETDSVTDVIEIIQKLPGFKQISHVVSDKKDSEEGILMKPFEDTALPEALEEETDAEDAESLLKERSAVDPEIEAEIRRRLIEELRRTRQEQTIAKEKNKFLGKKLCEYYQLKGPKDKNFLVDKSVNPEGVKKLYHKRLLEFNDMVQYLFSENEKRAVLLKEAKVDTKKMEDHLQNNFREFIAQERELVKTFNPYEVKKLLPHTSFEELINQQIKLDERLSKVRLEYVMTKNQLDDLKRKHAERIRKVKNLEAVDVVEYEKMRIRTQALNDKLEHKERQLSQMKVRLSHCVQSLAHARMKCAHLDIENGKLVNEIKETKNEIKNERSKCVKISGERKALEARLRQLEQVKGMEKYPHLLKEYDRVVKKMNNLDEELLNSKETLERKTTKLEEKLERHSKRARLREERNRFKGSLSLLLRK